MKNFLTTMLILTSVCLCSSQTEALFFEQANEFLKNNVTKEGKINYATLKKSPGELFYILNNISNLKLEPNPSREASIAYWINVYNLLIIKNVVDNYPVKAVNLIEGFFDKNFLINGSDVSLNDIENNLNIITQDAGIHFVLSKASNGDPLLYSGAYLPESALYQMSLQIKSAINKPDFLKINKENDFIEFPLLFQNYKKDFVTMYFNEIDFVNIFLEKKLNTKMKIGHYNFDWSLNNIN